MAVGGGRVVVVVVVVAVVVVVLVLVVNVLVVLVAVVPSAENDDGNTPARTNAPSPHTTTSVATPVTIHTDAAPRSRTPVTGVVVPGLSADSTSRRQIDRWCDWWARSDLG
jgi:hypothetical protein